MEIRKFEEINEEFRTKKIKSDEKNFLNIMGKVLKEQGGIINKISDYKIDKINDGHIRINMENGEYGDLYLNPPIRRRSDERFFIFNPKAGGGGVHKISKKLAKEYFDKLSHFATDENGNQPYAEDKGPAPKPVKTQPEEGHDLARFYSAIQKLDAKGQKTRKHQLANLYFRDFIGTDLLNSKIKSVVVDANIESDYYGMSVNLEDGGKVNYSFSKEGDNPHDGVSIEPYIDFTNIGREIEKDSNIPYNQQGQMIQRKKEDLKKEKKKVSRKDARIIGKITKKFNPNSKYFKGTGDLVIKEYESKVTKFNDYLNEKESN